MRNYFLISSFVVFLISSNGFASGVITGGGGMPGPTFVELKCEQGLQINFTEFTLNNVLWASNAISIQSVGSAPANQPVVVSRNNSGTRILSYGDAFCTRSLNEVNNKNWILVSHCEGKTFPLNCERL